ncbi:MAG TPA: hypothetical protein VJT49_09480 [Amycolatopsis sp.]|uniref:hypothetical protein n=1 Tax=Amycolatopsis sp. TaxID=37632 RepID=UPI002B4A40D5|nr:hypothetical protein [Amycolatopsis sp.]HKS45329.1 hypothetical protein [Amycolatopsis sp.]
MPAGKALFLVVLTGLCAVLGACGRPPAPSAGIVPGGPGLSKDDVDRQDAASRWANDYCVAVGSLVDELATMPSVDPSSPQRAVRTSSDLLASMISGLDKAVQGLHNLPPSPVAGGDKVRGDAVSQFTVVREHAAEAKKRLDKARDATQIDQQTLGAARDPLNEVSKIDLLNGFTTVPELLTASEHAPVCEQLLTREPPP